MAHRMRGLARVGNVLHTPIRRSTPAILSTSSSSPVSSSSSSFISQARSYSAKAAGTTLGSRSAGSRAMLLTTIGVTAAAGAYYSQGATTIVECEAPKAPAKDLHSSKVAKVDQKRRLDGVTKDSPMRLRMEAWTKKLQQEIKASVEKMDGKATFRVDEWEREEGGGGISMVMQDGKVFEKAGVGVSVVYGMLPPAGVAQMRSRNKNIKEATKPVPFFATGISCVMHPVNPNAPTVHFNYRYFEIEDEEGQPVSWWFGGGSDLTPSILYEEDAVHFHKVIKDACDRHDKSYYKEFKQWADKYFYLPHRDEARGIGGIFFDDLDRKDPDTLFKFVKDCGDHFLEQYMPIIQKRKDTKYTADDKHWQELRRGRYVEFNLVWDRGTKFGLATPGARIESVLMTLPLKVRWEYMEEPQLSQHGAALMKVLKAPRDWVPLN